MKKSAYAVLTMVLAGSFVLQGCVPAVVAGAGVASAGANTAASNNSVGSQIDDTGIKIKANAVLDQFPQLEYQSNVEIAVFNGVVLLLGQVPSQDLKDQIAVKIAAINGVSIVYNELQVAPTISFSQYAKDSWITTRVSTKFLGNVNPAHFKVITENAVVYIMAVTTQEEGDLAAKLASQVPGVEKVVKAYSYVQPPKPAVIENGN
jgi:osmotically-inducible protein OsmY